MPKSGSQKNAKRLRRRGWKIAGPVKPAPQAEQAEPVKAEVRPETTGERETPRLPKKQKAEASRPELQLVQKEYRRNLTLKVREENELKFNELFHKLQLKGDSRKKQDLADEALELLFTYYKSVLS